MVGMNQQCKGENNNVGEEGRVAEQVRRVKGNDSSIHLTILCEKEYSETMYLLLTSDSLDHRKTSPL